VANKNVSERASGQTQWQHADRHEISIKKKPGWESQVTDSSERRCLPVEPPNRMHKWDLELRGRTEENKRSGTQQFC
jgi:hypothetical protein